MKGLHQILQCFQWGFNLNKFCRIRFQGVQFDWAFDSTFSEINDGIDSVIHTFYFSEIAYFPLK